jgi:plastocyanin
MKVKELVPLILIVSVILTIGSILIFMKILPEEQAKNFHSLSDISLKTDLRVIRTPSLGDDTFIYAINPVAERALNIAQKDARVQQILKEQNGRALTIAAIQPTVLEGKDGKITYSPVGQIIITSNWQYVDGKLYSIPVSFNALENKTGESHQHIWNVFVDLDKLTVTGISEESERVMRKTLEPNLIYAGMNMFMPEIVKVNTGSIIKWFNSSDLPHNVVGIYKKTSSGSQVEVDSGFIYPNGSWKYNFNELGVFEYHCTIHSEDGMNGRIIVSSSQQ